MLDQGGKGAAFTETRVLFEQHLTFIEKKGKTFVQVVWKRWAECRGHGVGQKAHIGETAANSEEDWLPGETIRSTGESECHDLAAGHPRDRAAIWQE